MASPLQDALQAMGFRAGYLSSERRNAINAAPGVRILGTRPPLLEDPIVQHALEMAIERSGKEPDLATATVLEVLHDGVPVPGAVQQQQEYMEYVGFQGEQILDGHDASPLITICVYTECEYEFRALVTGGRSGQLLTHGPNLISAPLRCVRCPGIHYIGPDLHAHSRLRCPVVYTPPS